MTATSATRSGNECRPGRLAAAAASRCCADSASTIRQSGHRSRWAMRRSRSSPGSRPSEDSSARHRSSNRWSSNRRDPPPRRPPILQFLIRHSLVTPRGRDCDESLHGHEKLVEAAAKRPRLEMKRSSDFAHGATVQEPQFEKNPLPPGSARIGRSRRRPKGTATLHPSALAALHRASINRAWHRCRDVRGFEPFN